MITLDLPDWRTNPYRVPAIPQPAERFGPGLCSVSTCDPDELGRRMREMAEGRAVRVEGPKLPTWSEFKEWWTKEVDCA